MQNEFSVFLTSSVTSKQIFDHIHQIWKVRLEEYENDYGDIDSRSTVYGVALILNSNRSYKDDKELILSRYPHELSFEVSNDTYANERNAVAEALAMLFAKTFCDKHNANCTVAKNLEYLIYSR